MPAFLLVALAAWLSLDRLQPRAAPLPAPSPSPTVSQEAVAAQKRLAEQAVNGYLFELAQTGVWSAKLEGMWQNAPVEGVVLSGIRWTE